jgi:hypothetical protein
MCKNLARAVGFRLNIWKEEVVLHGREHQQKIIFSRCVFGKAVNQPIFIEDPLCPLHKITSARKSCFFPRNTDFLSGRYHSFVHLFHDSSFLKKLYVIFDIYEEYM